jgi:hypothetical protein
MRPSIVRSCPSKAHLLFSPKSKRTAIEFVIQLNSFHCHVSSLLQDLPLALSKIMSKGRFCRSLEQPPALPVAPKLQTGITERGGSFVGTASGRVLEPHMVGSPEDFSSHLDVPGFTRAAGPAGGLQAIGESQRGRRPSDLCVSGDFHEDIVHSL